MLGTFLSEWKRDLSLIMLWLFGLSIATNVILLVSPIYMTQVYDRVLSSGSQSTLLSLTIIACFLLAIYALSETGRKRILALVGTRIGTRASETLALRLLSARRSAESEATLQDAQKVQGFLLGGGALPLLDLPFTPLFYGLMFLLHPAIGLLGVGGAVVLVVLAVITDLTSSGSALENQRDEAAATQFLQDAAKSSSAVIAMGMRQAIIERWSHMREPATSSGLANSAISSFLSSVSKSFRQILQTLVLGLGAYLALNQELSPGAIVAASIVMGKALGPIDQIVGSWRQILLARESWGRLRRLAGELYDNPAPETQTRVGSIEPRVEARDLCVGAQGSETPLLAPINLLAEPRCIIGLVGPSGSGKSSILQCLAGCAPPLSGSCTLDGRDIHTWPDEDRGRFVGYLPQRVELLPGTVAQNIARFSEHASEDVVAAAERVGCHSIIMSLPNGYDERVGPGGWRLSAGQQQAIGLARVAYSNPKLILLDEPTANLDSTTATSFLQWVVAARKAGALVFVATHDVRILPHLDMLLGTAGGRVTITSGEELAGRLRSVPAAGGGTT